LNKCYLCGNTFDNANVKKHDEHIIQQAVGGNLTANDILCSKCGGTLGKEIDIPFNNIFDGISTRLDIKKDRNNSKSSSTKGLYVNLKYKFMALSWSIEPKKMNIFDFQYQYNQFCNETGEIEVLWKDFKISPLKPFHKYTNDKKQVIIYGNKKNATKYKKRVEKEISKKFNSEEKPEIVICDDLDGIIEYPFNMDNLPFKRGLAKIAIGFASKHDIKRENLPLLLDINKETKQGKIKNKILAIQFYPLGVIDRLIEIQKNEFDHYPFHNLILFTLDYDPSISNGKKVLICYIELFSTFQYYIVLNEEYYGETIYKYFAQQILKKDDYIFQPDRRHYKERNIILEPLGIKEEDIIKKYNNQIIRIFSKFKWSIKQNKLLLNKQFNFFTNLKTRWDIEIEMIKEETIKQKYKFNFEGYIHNIVSAISNQVMLVKNKKQFQKPEFKNSYFGKFVNNEYLMSVYDMFEDYENMINFKQNLDLFFSQEYNEEHDEVFSIDSYRKKYIENNNLKNYTDLIKHFETLTKSQAFRFYGHKKMYMLEDYIQTENIKYKTQQIRGDK